MYQIRQADSSACQIPAFVLETTIEQRLLLFLFFFVAFVVASLLNHSKSLWREGGLSGSIWPSPSATDFAFCEPFLLCFLAPTLSQENHICLQTDIKNGTRIGSKPNLLRGSCYI